jgi:hypothetical protein
MADTNWTRVAHGGGAAVVQDIVRRWPQSGETQRRYCMRHGISMSTFAYWRRHQAAELTPRSASSVTARTAPVAFREVVITGAAGPAPEAPADARAVWTIEVALPNGAVVRFSRDVGADAIPAILQAVVATC